MSTEDTNIPSKHMLVSKGCHRVKRSVWRRFFGDHNLTRLQGKALTGNYSLASELLEYVNPIILLQHLMIYYESFETSQVVHMQVSAA